MDVASIATNAASAAKDVAKDGKCLFWIEMVLVAVMATGVVGLLVHAILHKKPIGVRMIQFAAVSLLLPLVGILGLEHVLAGETVATLLGGVAGYLLGGLSDQEPKPTDDGKPKI